MSTYRSYKDGANQDIRETLSRDENQSPNPPSGIMASFRQKMYRESTRTSNTPSLFPPDPARSRPAATPFGSASRTNPSDNSSPIVNQANTTPASSFYNPGNRILRNQNQSSSFPREYLLFCSDGFDF